MRPFYLFISLLCLLALAACGTEEELIPPAFLAIEVNGAADTSLPFKDPSVTITGIIDDVSATLVANSTITGEVPVIVNSSDGTWTFTFAPLTAGANIISFTASDKRGNLNQMILTVNHDPPPPLVTSVVQSVADPAKPQLIVTFNEALLDTSLPTAPFSVVNTVDSVVVADSLIATVTTSSTVTLSLAAALPTGTYRLNCPGVKDIATPDGNPVAVGYFFDFTIVE